MLALFATFAAALAAGSASSETVVSANPLGGLGFTLLNVADFAVNVEHVRGMHGVMVEGTIVHVHGDPSHATVFGGKVGYRLHAAETDAPFVGVLAGYGTGYVKYYPQGHHHEEDRYLFDLQHTSVIPHIGYRWSIGEHGRLTTRAGAGWSDYTLTSDEKGDTIDAALAFSEDRLQFTPIKLDLELSLGFAF